MVVEKGMPSNEAGRYVVERIKDWAKTPVDIERMRSWTHMKIAVAEIKAKSGIQRTAIQLSLW